MAFMAVTIAELRMRVAELEVKAARLDIGYPGESTGTASRRYRDRQRLQCLARDYKRLIELAETGQ
ncbi:hypothetical protein DMA15_03745 [Streptomyces sp. WAC 01529]|uniref:hypothetical protein n=1 Tax=Streptomyces sp. WAC 01529 TaxID=2203205 RepID=UPI000F6F6B78|nr:hypothetical protein [Streptomyces sp. WAC 01529]AZM51807.1 hypothetical protein DMA15_03745 [Streptomyces sp. WAC 01529]